MQARTVTFEGHGGDEIEGYLATPVDRGQSGSVVVLHHMPGYDEATKEITRRFAAKGYNALCPNLHYRDAPGASPDDAAAASRANGGVPDDRLVGDTEGALGVLRALESANGKVATIGYCSGGRQSFLAACRLVLDAAVVCYGALIVGEPPEGMPKTMQPVSHLSAQLSCPVLGLFGAEDKFPTPAQVAELEQILAAEQKKFEFVTYENAGHAFFSVDRPSYRYEAANSGWQKIWEFFDRHLAE